MLFIIKKARSGKKFLPILLISSLLLVVGCVTAPSKGWSGATLSDGILYVGTIEGKVIALDASTGDLLNWEQELGETSSGGFGCSSGISTPMSTYGTPVVKDEVVYIGGYDGIVYAVTTPESPTAEYSRTFDTGSDIIGSPVVTDDTVFIGNSDGKLYALAVDNIKNVRWEFKTEGKIWATPAVDNGVVYIGSSDHKLYAINAETGKEIWRFEAEAGILSTPIIDNGVVYVGACDSKFYALDADDGEEIWHFEAGNWFWTKALIYNGEIWIGSLDHKVYVIDPQNPAEPREVLETEGRVCTPPVLVNGKIIVGSEDGWIYIIDPDNKTSKPLRELDAPIFAPIYAINPDSDPDNNVPDNESGVIYVHAQNGDHMLYAIDVESGEDIWEPVKTS